RLLHSMSLRGAQRRSNPAAPTSGLPRFARNDGFVPLSRQLHERQRLRGHQVDRPPALGAEGLAVEDQVRALALDRHLVDFLEVDARHLLALVPAGQAGEHRPQHARRPLVIASTLSAPPPWPPICCDRSILLSVVTARNAKRPEIVSRSDITRSVFVARRGRKLDFSLSNSCAI